MHRVVGRPGGHDRAAGGEAALIDDRHGLHREGAGGKGAERGEDAGARSAGAAGMSGAAAGLLQHSLPPSAFRAISWGVRAH